MSVLRISIKVALLTVSAGGSFGAVSSFMAAQSDAMPLPISISDPIAKKISQDNDFIGAKREMSPIYPTTKYTQAQLAPLAVKKQAKAKVAKIPANKMPMQIAYVPTPRG